MTETKKRGRPKLAEGKKGNYNVSRAEKARRVSQRSVSEAKKTREAATKKAERARERVKKKEKTLKKVEDAIFSAVGWRFECIKNCK